MELDKSIPQAFGEWVILECNAARKGEEVVSSGGIITGKRTDGDIPLYGTVISVGGDCPDDIKTHLIGQDVALPNGKINNIPDPRMAYHQIPKDSPKSRIFVCTHWKNIQALYFFEPSDTVVEEKQETKFTSSLLTLASATDLKKYS